MDVIIRDLALGDLESIPKLDVSSSEPGYDLVRTDSGEGLSLKRRDDEPPKEYPRWGARETASRLELWRRNHSEGCKFLGAFWRERLVGFCLLSSEQRSDSLAIYSIFVDRPCRGLGIGTKLVSAVEEHCRQVGAKGLYVTTTTSRGRAMEFYLKLGFRIVGLHDRCYDHSEGEVAFLKGIGVPNKSPQATE